MLVKPMWMNVFEGSEARFLEPGVSYHTPMVVLMGLELHHQKTPFKFFNFWASNPSFTEINTEAWGLPIRGSPPYKFSQRLKRAKLMLKELIRGQYSDIQKRIVQARNNLFIIQDQLKYLPGDVLLKKEKKEAISKLAKYSSTEEALMHKKSRNLWIAQGDQNTAYFHNYVKARINQNKILSLTKEDNTRLFEVH